MVGMVWIMIKATYYVIANKVYKPGTVSLTLRLFDALRIIVIYGVLSVTVFLQVGKFLISKSLKYLFI